jgi:hypothetical protein
MSNKQQYTLELSDKEALVLFEFLSRFGEAEKLSIEDTSERWVLSDILAILEKKMTEPLHPDYREILKKAQEEIKSTHEGSA